jgi:hypothetical protein
VRISTRIRTVIAYEPMCAEEDAAMDAEMGGKGLDPAKPALWPTHVAHFAHFAQSGDIVFDWDPGGYRIFRWGSFKNKVFARFPMTEEGWVQCWSALQTDYPDLAAAVIEQIQLEQNKVRRRDLEQQFRDELLAAQTLTSVSRVVLLGGHGFGDELQPRASMDLYFTTEGLWATRASRATPVMKYPYAEMVALDFDGPGRITRGGGFIGGGFGLLGAVEGMAIAAVLNSLTTRSEIESLIRVEAPAMEAFFFTDTATPRDLRIQFSGVLGRIKRGSLDTVTGREEDPLDRLERLAALHRQGSLTDDEFAAMKRQLIGEI